MVVRAALFHFVYTLIIVNYDCVLSWKNTKRSHKPRTNFLANKNVVSRTKLLFRIMLVNLKCKTKEYCTNHWMLIASDLGTGHSSGRFLIYIIRFIQRRIHKSLSSSITERSTFFSIFSSQITIL